MVERAVLEKAFAEGGSVLINGVIITRIEDLPSEFELAEGDAGRQAAVLAQEEADLAAAQERVARLRAQVKSNQSGKQGTTDPQAERAAHSPSAELRANLEALTVAELGAEADAAGIEVPSTLTRKADIIDFILHERQK
jgi:hypothetical protein